MLQDFLQFSRTYLSFSQNPADAQAEQRPFLSKHAAEKYDNNGGDMPVSLLNLYCFQE